MRSRIAIAIAAMVLIGASCASVEQQTTGRGDEEAVQAVVRASFEAENDQDVDGFLKLWTDEGLKEYDVGSREELHEDHGHLGEEQTAIHRFAETTVDESSAETIVDATRVESQVVKPLFRLKFELIKRENEWFINGFEFMGGPPPADGAQVLDIRAQEYAFVLDREEVPSDVAFTFTNAGKEQHEITLFQGPDDLTIEKAGEDLADIDGSELDNVPNGYKVDHIAFAEPGDAVDVAFAEEIPPGTYVLACYIPEGGLPEDGPDPDAKSHFELGMRSLLKVE